MNIVIREGGNPYNLNLEKVKEVCLCGKDHDNIPNISVHVWFYPFNNGECAICKSSENVNVEYLYFMYMPKKKWNDVRPDHPLFGVSLCNGCNEKRIQDNITSTSGKDAYDAIDIFQ